MDNTKRQYTKGSRELAADDISFDCDIEYASDESGAQVLEFYLETWFNPYEVFGTDVGTIKDGKWVNAYVACYAESGNICDDICIIIKSEDDDKQLYYRLSKSEKELIYSAMDAYCLDREGKSLLVFLSQR